MHYTTARTGRVFVLRLEDGDVLHECVEELARREGVSRAAILWVGGADAGSKLVVGPADSRAVAIEPMLLALSDAHEAGGAGTLFPDEKGNPILHLHGAFGRGADTRVGCVRKGVRTWLVGEVILIELTDCTALRRRDPQTGFDLLATEA